MPSERLDHSKRLSGGGHEAPPEGRPPGVSRELVAYLKERYTPPVMSPATSMDALVKMATDVTVQITQAEMIGHLEELSLK